MLPNYSYFDQCWHGCAVQLGNRDGIICVGDTLDELKQAFRDSVDDYLELYTGFKESE
jgi:predicted HicB family RNase H-like nuclease